MTRGAALCATLGLAWTSHSMTSRYAGAFFASDTVGCVPFLRNRPALPTLHGGPGFPPLPLNPDERLPPPERHPARGNRAGCLSVPQAQLIFWATIARRSAGEVMPNASQMTASAAMRAKHTPASMLSGTSSLMLLARRVSQDGGPRLPLNSAQVCMAHSNPGR